MRNTKQKSMVLAIVNNSCNHPTAREVFQECKKKIPNISLGTVYRNLNTLLSQGKIQKVEVPGHIDRYDKVLNHDHFICIHCGKIIDVDKKNISHIEMINGNKIIDYKIHYKGICYDCLEFNKGE